MPTNDSHNQDDHTEVEQPDRALAAGIVSDLIAVTPIVIPAASAAMKGVNQTMRENRANRQHAEIQYAQDADDARRGVPESDA